jgi:hypothetical protein
MRSDRVAQLRDKGSDAYGFLRDMNTPDSKRSSFFFTLLTLGRALGSDGFGPPFDADYGVQYHWRERLK